MFEERGIVNSIRGRNAEKIMQESTIFITLVHAYCFTWIANMFGLAPC